MEFCVEIGGSLHCFDIERVITPGQIKGPDPHNMPPFELATAVLQLLEVYAPAAPSDPYVTQLTDLTHNFIGTVQKSLPPGVQLRSAQET
jgi:hypothetical protein